MGVDLSIYHFHFELYVHPIKIPKSIKLITADFVDFVIYITNNQNHNNELKLLKIDKNLCNSQNLKLTLTFIHGAV